MLQSITLNVRSSTRDITIVKYTFHLCVYFEEFIQRSYLFRFDPIAAKVIGNAFKSKAKWNPFTGVSVKCQIRFYFSAESWMLLWNISVITLHCLRMNTKMWFLGLYSTAFSMPYLKALQAVAYLKLLKLMVMMMRLTWTGALINPPIIVLDSCN